MTFLCFLCRRVRNEICHRLELPCKCEVVEICQERCADTFTDGGMSVQRYAEFYGEVHAAICKKGVKMKEKEEPNVTAKDLPPPTDYIEDVFGDKGFLSKGIPNYRRRESQIAISRAIEQGIRSNRHVVAEGPTGTGKSLAYCVPAAYYAAHAGLRVCIVTSNKALQEQIYSKDLTSLKKSTKWDFTYAVRKGMNSYLCKRDLHSEKFTKLIKEVNIAQSAAKASGHECPESDLTERMIHSTVEWAYNTAGGDRELIKGLAPSNRVWGSFGTTSEDCDGRSCADYNSCHSVAAKNVAADANIVITNYWLFFMHVRGSNDNCESNIFSKFDIVIFDEAHNAADIARGFWGLELSKFSVRRAIAGLRHDTGGMVLSSSGGMVRDNGETIWDKCWSEADDVWDQVEHIAKKGEIRLRQRGQLRTEKLERALIQAAGFYYRAGRDREPKDNEDKSPAANEARREAGKLHRKGTRCEEIQIKLNSFNKLPMLDEDRWKRQVYYIEQQGSGWQQLPAKLMSKSLFVGSELHYKLFKKYRTVVLTSATLAVSAGDHKFRHIKREIGLDGLNPIELTVDSPFMWSEKSLLVVLDEKTIPSLSGTNKDKDSLWKKQLPSVMERIVRMTKGRAILLFTANDRKQEVGEYLKTKDLPFKVLTEKMATPAELQEVFRSDVSSILLGSKRFSEGIDIQGEACSCVIIDRIPFKRPGDPLMDSIAELRAMETGSDLRTGKRLAFDEHSLPEAIISFKQRMGRLIRTVSDCGIVVVCDDRLWNKEYRHRFIASIPNVKRTPSLEDAEAFMTKLGLL